MRDSGAYGHRRDDGFGRNYHYEADVGKQDEPYETWSRDGRWRRGGAGPARGSGGWRERRGREGGRRAGDGARGEATCRSHDSRSARAGGGDGRYRLCDARRARGSGADLELTTPCIWIGGCPDDIGEREIVRVCSKFGPVQSVAIKHSDRDTYAFVGYERMSHAKDAIRGLDQVPAFGTGVVKVAPANRKADVEPRGRGAEPPPPRPQRGGNGRGCCERSPPARARRSRSRRASTRPIRVYLSQLPRDMEEDELQEIAAEYGKVLQYELHREGAYKCGWVEYASKAEAETAVSELDDRRMDDWTMRLQAYMYPGGGP
uniref:RRM domain-containing protein n=1 Tax=Alexandrium monilatum TaxID=311494 RepID=A0A6T1A854_9DINO